jgi:cytochrome b pre-mRNA-processing protein 3
MFSPRPAVLAGRRLYLAAAAQARAPAFYLVMGAPDTVEGRFELYTLHVALLLRRLTGEGAEAAEASQALFDAFVRGLDDALREMGVGDLSVGKKMRRLGEAFYGRLRNYDAAFTALPDRGPLEAILSRTVLIGTDGDRTALGDYVAGALARLQTQPAQDLLNGEPAWPAP